MSTNEDQLPEGGEFDGEEATLADQWRATMVENGGKKGTISTYYKAAKHLLQWAEKSGFSLNELPPNTPEELYTSMKLKARDPRRNTYSSAIKAFVEFLNSIGIGVPPLSYPPTIGPGPAAQQKLKEWQDQQRAMKEQAAMEAENAEHDGGGAEPEVDGVPVAVQGEAPEAQPEASPPDAGSAASPAAPALAAAFAGQPNGAASPGAGEPAGEAGSAAQSPQPLTSPPAHKRSRDYVPAEPAARRGVLNSVVGQPRVGAGVPRNPLKLMLPPNGRLRIMRRSDGSDGEQLGALVPIGDYTQDDVAGYPDIKAFIQAVLHPGLAVQRQAMCTYIVKEIDEYGRISARSHEVKVPNGIGGPNPVGPGQVDLLVRERISKLEKEADEERKKLKEQLEDAKKNGDSAWVMTIMSLLDDRKRREIPSKDEIRKEILQEMGLDLDDDVPVRRGRIVGPGFGAMAPPPPNLPPRESPIKEVAGLFMPMVMKMMEPKQDPMSALLLKHFLDAKTTPAVSPELAEMKAEMRRLADKNEQLTRELATKKESNSLQEVMANVTAFMNMQEKLGGGGASTVEAVTQMVETIADKAPQIIDSFAKLRGGAPPQITAGRNGQQPKEKLVLPAAAEQAIRALYAAPAPVAEDIEGQQGIINAVWSVISALAQDKAWEPAAKAAHAELQKVETYDDLHMLVTKLLKTCGAADMMKQQPHFASKISNVLASNFPFLYQQLFGESRVLPGFALPSGEPVNDVQTSPPSEGTPAPANEGVAKSPSAEHLDDPATVDDSEDDGEDEEESDDE